VHWNSRGILLLHNAVRESYSPTHQRELLDAAVTADPDYAWAWWQCGLFHLEHGDKIRAVADIRQGNRLPLCPIPKPFPSDIFAEAVAEGRPAAAVATWEPTQITTEFAAGMLVRDTIVLKLSAEDFPIHSELFTQLYRMACRIQLGEPNTLLTALTMLASSGAVTQQVSDFAAVTPIEPELEQLLQAVDGLHSRSGQLGTAWLQQSTQRLKPNAFTILIRFARERLSPGYSDTKYMATLRDECRYVRESYTPYFSALAELDFNNPKVTPAMQHLLDTVPDPYPQETADRAAARKQLQPDSGPPTVPDAADQGWRD
jgi:hypothetical protein